MRRAKQGGLVTASEIACWVYCPEQWRLQYGLGLPVENQTLLAAGSTHHAKKAVAERIAGGLLVLGRLLVLIALLMVLLWVVLWR